MAEVNYKEVGRLKLTDSLTVVLTEIYRKEELLSYSLGRYIESDKFTGFRKDPLSIPEEMVVSFLSMFRQEDLQLALDQKKE